jgi:hypothetical protein
VGRPAREGGPVENDAPRHQRREAEQRAHGRRLAHPVAPDECERFAFVEIEIDAVEHLRVAVARFDRLDAEHHAISSSPR